MAKRPYRFFIATAGRRYGAMKMKKTPPKMAENGPRLPYNGQTRVSNGKSPQFYEFNPYYEYDELADWSRQVKIKAGWVCEFPGCGQMDRKLLESHHIKPKFEFPELAKDVKNGNCLCIYHHALAHWKNENLRNKILARLAIIYHLRFS